MDFVSINQISEILSNQQNRQVEPYLSLPSNLQFGQKHKKEYTQILSNIEQIQIARSMIPKTLPDHQFYQLEVNDHEDPQSQGNAQIRDNQDLVQHKQRSPPKYLKAKIRRQQNLSALSKKISVINKDETLTKFKVHKLSQASGSTNPQDHSIKLECKKIKTQEILQNQAMNIKNEEYQQIEIYNQLKIEIGKIHLQKNDTLEKIFQILQSINESSQQSSSRNQINENQMGNKVYNFQNYYLSTDLIDDSPLFPDYQIKNLPTNRIYIKRKKYQDQTDPIAEPFKIVAFVSKKFNFTSPIGVTQASMYEEFEVIKINKYGKKQNRILGIDQMKVYNFDSKIWKQKNQVSSFAKFFGLDEIAGTKKPYRMVKDIKSIKKQGDGYFTINYKQKQINYMADKLTTEKILRKLIFLIKYHKQNN